MQPATEIQAVIECASGSQTTITLLSRIDTQNEMEYYRDGGILQYVLRKILKS